MKRKHFILALVAMLLSFAPPIFAQNVAKVIGGTEYTTFAEAVKEAPAGGTVELIADATENVTVELTKNLTIDGAGHTFTGAIEFKKDKGYFTVKNVNFNGAGTRVYALKSRASTTSLTVENCEATGYTYGFLYANKAVTNLIVEGVKVKDVTYGVHSAYGTNVTLNNFVAQNVEYGVMVQNYGTRKVVLNNCSFTGSENPLYIWERNQTNKITFNFQGVNEMGKADYCTSAMAVVNAGAQVGTKVYKTLDAAFAAAQDGDEVKVLTAGTYALSTSGKNITITGAVDGVVFDNIGAKNMGSANVTFNNVTFDYYPNVNYTGLQHSGNLVYNNCTINGQVFLYGQSETFNKCTFNQNSADAYNVWTYGAKEVDFNECTFNSAGKSVLVYTESATITNDVAFTKCELNASDSVEGKAAIEIDTSLSAGATITVDGATTANGFGSGNVSGNSLWNNKKGNADAANNDVTVVVNDETVLAPEPDVAKIGETGYRTLAAAISAATAGQTITLIADINENVTISKSLTIDGAGKQYTGKMTGNKGLTVTIQNVNFVNGGFDKPKTQSSTTGTYTFKNCTFDGAGTYAYPLSIRGANKIIVEDCSVKNYRYSFLYVVSSALNVSVKNVTVEDCPNYAVYFASGVTTATFEGLTVKNADNGFLINNTANRSFTIKDCKMENVTTAINHAGDETTGAINCTALGVNDFGGAALSQYAVIKAQAQSGSLYGDLASVVEAADATVTLLADATGAGAVIDKNLTIDFGGKTYTFNQTVGSTGTTTLGFQILKGNDVTLKNGTLTSTAAVMGSKEVKMLIQNYANLTLEDMNLIDNTEHIQYALSNNSGNTVIKGNTNITTDAVAFDVYDYTSGGYAVPTVTVETTGTIDGKIEVSESINDNLQIKSGIYTMDVNEWCAPGFICKANEDGKYGIEKANFKLNDTYYATLDEAIAAIDAGNNVIELLADATFNYGAREAYGTEETTSVTINGNGHTLTLNQTNSDWSSFGLAAGKVAFNNVTIEKVGYGDTSGAWNTHAIIFSSPVEMTDVTVNQSMAVQAGATLKNVTINEANGFYGLWINGNGQAVTVDGGAINATNGGRGIKIADQYIASPAQVTLSVTDTKFSTAKKAAVLVSSKAGAAITAENVDITEVVEDNVNFVWVDEDWAQYFANVTVTGATVAQESMGDFAVTINNSAYFKTLAKAIEAATAGQTITLLADINESVTLSKSVTIDGAGKKYTGTMTGNADLTVTVKNVNFVNGGFVKNTKSTTGTYTFTDCTFDGAGTYAYPLSIRGAKTINVENCTVKDYVYSFLYVRSSTLNVNVKDVTVEDCPNYAVYFASGVNKATFENLTVKNADDGFLINNAGTRNLTIKDCTMENVTTAINHAGGTYKINCTARGFNDFGGAAMSEYVNFTAEAKAGAVVGDFAGVVAAAQENATVTLLSDITLTTATYAEQNDGYAVLVNADKSMTIDLNGKAVTVNAAKADLTATKGKMLLAVFHAEPGTHLTLDDSSAEGTANVTLNVNDANVYSMFSTESPSGTTSGKLTVNGGNYTTVGKLSNAMIFTDSNDAVVINGGNFYCDGATTSSKYPWMVNTTGNNEVSVVVTGGTFNTDINHQYRPFEVEIDKELALRDNGDGTWTIVPAVAYITEMLGSTVNESGSHEHNVGYATLADAIDAAKAEGTVTLVADAAGAGVVINKDVTIDFNEKTYTFNEGVGSTGTESNGFQILKGNDVTLKNGTLNVAAEAAGKFYILVQNYADLTVEDMTLDGTNLDKWSLTDGDSYVLSNNSGNVLVTGNTNITANNDGDKAFAFDACTKAGYDAPVVTVETTGKIAGKIENSATIAIKSGTFTTPILPEWCAQYYAPVDNGDGTYGVVYTYVDEMTIDDDKYFKGEMPAEGFVNKNEQTVGTLTYKRTFNKVNVWQALYVPFEIPVAYLSDLGYEVAYLYDVHNKVVAGEEIDPAAIESVHFVKITKGTLRASYPYIIRPTSEADLTLSLTLYDAKLYSTDKKNDVESSTTTTRYIFTGTYADAYSTDITGDANIPCARINSSGNWQKMSATAILVPFRICMYIVNKDGSPVIMSDEAAKSIQIRVIGEESEDETTGIKFYEFDNEQTSDYIYDLHGRRVMEPQKGSIYIVNGKKVVF